MKVSLTGLARAIKDALRGPRKRELSYMVDELVRHIGRLDVVDESLDELLAEPGDSVAIHNVGGGFVIHFIHRGAGPAVFYRHDNLVAALTLAVDSRREMEVM